MLLLLGLGLCVLSALSCVWEMLALQMPDSPMHVGVLAGPIAQLRNFSFGLGVGSLVLSLCWPQLFAAGTGKVVAWLWLAGALLHVAALCYAATQGMVSVQFFDPRLDARVVVYTRAIAHALSVGALLMVSARAVREPTRT